MTGPRKVQRRSEISFLDLPEALLISILKHLPLKSKIHSQTVSRDFRDILSKPHRGSNVWNTIELDDPVFEKAHPTALASWLMQRVHGIKVLHCSSGSPPRYRDPAQAVEVQRKRHTAYRILTRLPALLSPEVEMHVDLHFDHAEQSLQSLEPALGMPRRCNFVQSYWADLASSLTILTLHGLGVDPATTSALNQLARLQTLFLNGSASDHRSMATAHMNLSMAQLLHLRVDHYAHVRIQLNCPQLKSLELLSLRPLEALENVPQGISRVGVAYLSEGSLSLEEIFQGQMLDQVTFLRIERLPEAYESPAALQVFDRVFRNGRLRQLCTNYTLDKLERHLYGLPKSLQHLKIHLPLQTGLPVVLEQLTNLKDLVVINTGQGPMHLDRPLDPFLDMVHFERLEFCSGGVPKKHDKDWTADALKVLGRARRSILMGSLMPAGRKVDLIY